MAEKEFKPYVAAKTSMKELSIRAVLLGVVMALVLGTANAYVGMKAGLTVAAIFPAAVVAMAALRVVGGTILEENIARTTASVGEALVAGAIFTIPAFLITGVWTELNYWQSSLIMLIGGLLGILFVIMLRRALVSESDLPFPESIAASEMVKAGQGGQTGAKYLFANMGLAALWELFKNPNGIAFVNDSAKTFVSLAQSKIQLLGQKFNYDGGFYLQSPSASPMLMGVGFIIGPNISAVLFAGAVMGWMFLVPAGVLLNSGIEGVAHLGSWVDLAEDVWYRQIRPLAVGTMIVAAFYTLYNMRTALFTGISKALGDIGKVKEDGEGSSRIDIDLNLKTVMISVAILTVPLFLLYYFFSDSLPGSLTLTVLMVILGFFFAAVAGYLVGVVGSSNNPISGLTLSSLLIAALLMLVIGVTGKAGIAAVLGVAGVVCCAAGIAGDMMQDLKVGHMLGGTPWRMEIGEIIGVIVASLVLVFPMQLMHNAYGIGSANLPAPQAGLMALMSQGIVGGEMAWPLVISGMFLGLSLILIKAPAPMLIAVGMYLPFNTTAAIFVGGIIKWILDKQMAKRNATDEQKTKAENTGLLISSGLIAGESLMAVILALLFGILDYTGSGFALANLGLENPSAWLGLLAFAGLLYLLVKVPMKAATEKA
ncbi:MAG: oligopeptide transporter, OPT family [Deferribacteres bacterium]|nr:oligopeptide transporter, OPT family [candidate division KSB1 bacterium]MCB9508981.1 oligopeptide transporter, OPT family [Deferribacteres bacterium]